VSQSDDQYLASLKKRYAKATKKQRSQILDEYVQTTGCHRKHAVAVLSGKRQRVKGPIHRPRRALYTNEDVRAIESAGDLFDGVNSKRLRAALDVELPHLRAQDAFQVSPASYDRLETISPATIDRLRAKRGRLPNKSRSHTKPGTLLKDQIPIRTWADWNEDRPGFTEMDLVAHDGGNARGDYIHTLDFTDIKTGWTECVAARNKAQKHVFAAICTARQRLPFPLLGVDSDNGSEFINDELLRYCEQEHLTFTRGRSGYKNDSAHAEQKNWSVVRRSVGYLRYDTPAQLKLLNRLYEGLHFYVNFFLPVMKLKAKVRRGSKVTKTYDKPQTPYARVLANPHVSVKVKTKLRATYRQLDVVELRHQIDDLIDQLLATQHS
jgi:hypothetical protein